MGEPLPDNRDKVAKLLGRLRREAGDDSLLLGVIMDAGKDPPREPVAWISARIRRASPTVRRTGAQQVGLAERLAKFADEWEDKDGVRHPLLMGWRLVDTANRVMRAARIDPERWSGGFESLPAWLRDGLNADTQLVPLIERVASRPGYPPGGPASLKYLDAAVRENGLAAR